MMGNRYARSHLVIYMSNSIGGIQDVFIKRSHRDGSPD